MIVILSPEDNLWIEAMVQRQEAYYGNWARHYAIEARNEVVKFYLDRYNNDVFAPAADEITLRLTRLKYESETYEIKRWHDKRREENLKLRRRVELKNKLLQCQFDAVGGRSRWVYAQRLRGYELSVIGRLIGVGKARVAQIVAAEERREIIRNRRFLRLSLDNKGRPIDMGGPRDVWLTYDITAGMNP